MRRFLALFFVVAVVISSCAPKPSYMTREGKRKLKYYNDFFYGRQ